VNKEVANIDWSNDEIVIKCADGSTFNADHVIVTVSLGVLKDRHTSLFTPNLPSNNIQAIENIGYGGIGKVFLEFDEPFDFGSESESKIFNLLWRTEDINEIKGTDREWITDLFMFLKVDAMPKLIEAFVSGKNLRKFEELSDEKLFDDCMWLLKKFLGREIPEPTAMARTKWLTNRNFLGTYSYLSMDSQKFHILPQNLSKSVEKDEVPVILFAGEAADFKYPGFVHGAISSGWRAADELIDALK
jgi:spermine oxidase